MKKLQAVLTIAAVLFLGSCTTTKKAGNSGKVPPGQAKKMTGSQSAKPYAPGQQKKN